MSTFPELSSHSEKEQYEAHVGRLARGAGISSFGQGISKILSYGTQVALARLYGPAQLGFYVLGFTVVQIASVLAQLGMDNAVVRYIAHYQTERDYARVKGTILLAFSVTLLVSLMLSGVIFFGAPSLATLFDKPSMETVFRVFSVAVPFFAVMSITLWATQGFQTVKYATYVQQILLPLANLVLISVFYLFGARILGAVAAYTLSVAVGAALALYYLMRIFPKLLDRSTPSKFETRVLFSISVPMMVANLARSVNVWAPVTVLGIFSSASAVGIYNAAARTAVFCSLVLMAFTGIFSPMVSNLYSRGLLTDLGQLYKDVCRWVLTGSLAVVTLMVLLARDVLAVFGQEFIAGWVVLVIIAGSELFDNSAGPADRLLAMTGHQKIVMLATVGYASVGIAGSFALVPFYGMVGAAVAMAAATIVLNTVMLLAVRRLLGFSPYNYGSLKPVIAGLLAAIVTLSIRLVLQLPEGLPAILVLTLPFLVSFAAIMVVLGLSPSDRQLLEAFWRTFRQVARRNVGQARNTLEED